MDQAHGHTLLLVDDEQDVLDSLRHLFRRQYRILACRTGAEALAVLAREDVHIILSDQRMPGMHGDELLARARVVRPEAIRLLFTGYAEIPAIISAINQGQVFRFIHKPWDVEELQSVVRQAVEQYDLQAERRRLLAELRAANAELTRANAELEDSNAARTAFLEVASHELNTPITVLQGLTHLLRLARTDRDAAEREIVDRICAASARLARLVDTMLKATSSPDFAGNCRWRATDLVALLNGVIEELRPFAAARGQEIHWHAGAEFPDWSCDPPRLRDAFHNLLANAIKFTPDCGHIEVRLEGGPGGGAHIEVIDRGIGLDPVVLEHLFEPFYTQRDPATHHSGSFAFGTRGLGLGLFLVRKFVESHRGSVRVESSPGVGTTFTIDLPWLDDRHGTRDHARGDAVAADPA